MQAESIVTCDPRKVRKVIPKEALQPFQPRRGPREPWKGSQATAPVPGAHQ